MKNSIAKISIAIALALLFVVSILVFVEIYSGASENGSGCATSLVTSQWPRFLACAMARHEGLAGGLIAAAAALIAGWMAYTSALLPLLDGASRRTEKARDAKVAAILSLTQPVHAAATALSELRKVLAAGGAESRTGKEALITVTTYVEQSLHGSMIKNVIPELAIDDRLLATMIVERLQTFVVVTKYPGPYLTAAERCQLHIDTLLGIRPALRGLDKDLADVFDRDGGSS